jgi:hypothetical protein
VSIDSIALLSSAGTIALENHVDKSAIKIHKD